LERSDAGPRDRVVSSQVHEHADASDALALLRARR
jgi:hypothetical protein